MKIPNTDCISSYNYFMKVNKRDSWLSLYSSYIDDYFYKVKLKDTSLQENFMQEAWKKSLEDDSESYID